MLAPVWDTRADGGDDPITIPIEDGGSNDPGPLFRNPSPIICVYNAMTFILDVTFLVDLGSVVVEIENQTTGEYTQTQVNAQAGPMFFPITHTTGLWSIVFTLENGIQYFGEFIL